MDLSTIAGEFSRAIELASNTEELRCMLCAISHEMGFHHFALTHHVDLPTAPQPAIRIHNYPSAWEAFFDAEQLGPSDPVHRASHLTTLGFRWPKLPEMLTLTPRDVVILELSRKAGIGDGFTVPAHIPGESAGSCSFATRAGKSLRNEWVPLIQLVGAMAFESARRLSGVSRPDPGRPRLTDRQRDCVYWAARGKSDWEISIILGISHDTVIQHLKEARARYGVTKRTQLTVHALYDGALTFTDVLRR